MQDSNLSNEDQGEEEEEEDQEGDEAPLPTPTDHQMRDSLDQSLSLDLQEAQREYVRSSLTSSLEDQYRQLSSLLDQDLRESEEGGVEDRLSFYSFSSEDA
jgi:hypothetical protein